MFKIFALCLSTVVLLATTVTTATADRVPPESRTLYHYAETAWAVGTLNLGKPLTFREGRVLVFPSQITDLLWAPGGTKPRNLMLVYEVANDDKDKPLFAQNDTIFAPLRLLPEHSYWKDNLPNTRRHEVAGGPRYAFRGDEIAEVRKYLTPYMAAFQLKSMDRWKGEIAAVAAALESKVVVLREDSVRYFAVYPSLARDFDAKALPPIVAYLSGDAPSQEKARLVGSLANAKVEMIKPALIELGAKDDATAAVALRGLSILGVDTDPERLIVLSRASSEEMRAFAVEMLGRQVGANPEALARCTEVLQDEQAAVPVRAGTIAGLTEAGNSPATTLLLAQVAGGGTNSRASAEALATIGGSEAEAGLTRILKKEKGQAAIAAAVGLSRMGTCANCGKTLHEQHDSHPDPAVREMIAVVLQLPMEHKH